MHCLTPTLNNKSEIVSTSKHTPDEIWHAMRRDFLVFKSRQICSWDSFIENFITFPLLD